MLNKAEIKLTEIKGSYLYDGESLFDLLMKETKWEQRTTRIMGKTIAIPRMTAFYGNEYTYSGIKHEANALTPLLYALLKIAENAAGVEFNSVLLNLYRDGSDSVSWHSDNEKELGEDPVIASMSFGGTRKFKMKSNDNSEKLDLLLKDGSLLIMGKGTQANYVHCVPKSKTYTQPRINITFRYIE